MKYQSKREAVREWVNEFNAIPMGVIGKLLSIDLDELVEITPPSEGDSVYIFDGEYRGHSGEIIRKDEENDDCYIVNVDGCDESISIRKNDFDVEHEGSLPMWGTMWAFGSPLDNYWLDTAEGRQAMADCGFRIYKQEDYGYIFGIDGAGYSFYDAHWIPLYDARGLKWHEEEAE